MSTLRVNNITDLGDDYPGVLTYPGQILQVVSATKTDTYSESTPGNSWTSDIPGLSVSITPMSSNSKILVRTQITGCEGVNGPIFASRVLRNGIAIGVGDAAGSRTQGSSSVRGNLNNSSATTIGTEFLDSPSTTSEITYTAQIHNGGGSTLTMYINRASNDADSGGYYRSVSTITAMEVAG